LFSRDENPCHRALDTNQHETDKQVRSDTPNHPPNYRKNKLLKSYKSTAIIITMNIDQETGETIGRGRSPRFTYWVAFFAFATITMGSGVSVVSHSYL
jgi:hypothetical protein